jgi:YHS domain-containing protein
MVYTDSLSLRQKEKTMKRKIFYTLAAAVLLCGAALASDKKEGADPMAWQRAHYPLKTCVVGGDELGAMGKPYEHVHEGRLVMFCCKGCLKDFAKDPASHIAKLDAAAVAEQGKNYPLDTCVVGGDKLGAMGKPYDHVHEGRLVRLCCKGCLKDFKKDPASYVKKLDEAAAKASAPKTKS